MAHIRKDSSRPTTTVSWEQELLEMVIDYQFESRKDNRSQAINELVKLGLRVVERRKEKAIKQKALC